MDVSAEIRYPGARLDDVVAMVLDPEFRAAVCEATMALHHDVWIEHADDGTASVTVSRTLPAYVPDFVKRFVGETITLMQVERWAAADTAVQRSAGLDLTVVGQPARMSGTILVEEYDDGTVEVITGDLRVSLPLIGSRVESEIAKGVVAAARKEQEAGIAWLAR
jgi:hypothetical protein